MCNVMQFPETVEEFMEDYKTVDTKQVYSNGTEFVPIFRMKQWFQAHEAIPVEWIKNWTESGGSEPVDDFIDVDAYCDGYQKNVIECLLRSWRKENATN